MNDKIAKLIAIFLGLIFTFFKCYGMIIVLVASILLLDFLTGLVKAKIIGEPISSKKGTVGFWKKIAKILALVMGIFLDCFVPILFKMGVNYKMPVNLPFGLIIGSYIIIIELISICENLGACGVPLPAFILKMLKGAEEQLDKK